MHQIKKQVIIVAGGRGERLKANNPKQFLAIAGKPVLMHTMQKFFDYSNILEIILVIPAYYFNYWESLCKRHQFTLPYTIEAGGDTRCESVKNGLQHVADDALVAVHDGVRPLIDVATIARVYDEAEKEGTAVPVIPINQSLRRLEEAGSKQVKREQFVIVQTPQCFRADILKKAYLAKRTEQFTDDASVVEADGASLHLVPGNPENMKITYPFDLRVAAALLSK